MARAHLRLWLPSPGVLLGKRGPGQLTESTAPATGNQLHLQRVGLGTSTSRSRFHYIAYPDISGRVWATSPNSITMPRTVGTDEAASA